MPFRFGLAAMAALTVTACVNLQPTQTVVTKSDTSGYDAQLAEELGADEFGMKSYILVILKTGPADSLIKGDMRDELFAGHFSNIRKLAAEEKLVLAGPFDDPEKVMRGLFILNVENMEDAQAIVESDPAIKAGIFTTELTKYYGSAALIQVNEIHQSITKTR